MPHDHPLAHAPSISLGEIVREPLIGIEPSDPYGRILAEPFRQFGFEFDFSIKARTGQTIAALVAQGLGVALIDELSLAGPFRFPGIAVRPISEPTTFRTYAAFNADSPRSIFADALVGLLRDEMNRAAKDTVQN